MFPLTGFTFLPAVVCAYTATQYSAQSPCAKLLRQFFYHIVSLPEQSRKIPAAFFNISTSSFSLAFSFCNLAIS